MYYGHLIPFMINDICLQAKVTEKVSILTQFNNMSVSVVLLTEQNFDCPRLTAYNCYNCEANWPNQSPNLHGGWTS